MARKVGITTDEVVATAATIADAEGLGAATLARVAEHLGVRSPSLYAHVDGLPGLRRHLTFRGAAELTATLAAAVEGNHPGRDLTALCRAYRRFATEHRGLYEATQVGTPSPDADAELAAALMEPVRVVAHVLVRGGIGPADTIHAVRALRAALHGFVVLERDQGFGLPHDVDESFERLVAVVVAGVGLAD